MSRRALAPGGAVECTAAQANYLGNVMRLRAGDAVLLFNGRDGEWLAEITGMKRNACALTARELVRPQTGGPDVHFLFAPLKMARLDYMVQKATEMGVAALRPVITRRTIAERVKIERMRANAIEAAEQCGVLRVPDIHEPQKLDGVLRDWTAKRVLIFADETASVASPLEALQSVPQGPSGPADRPRRRFRRGGARSARAPAFRLSHLARSARHARRYGGGGRARADQRGARRLALNASGKTSR